MVTKKESGDIQVESLCMNCGKQGITKFLLVDIPHFKEMIVSAFECEHCGMSNNELQSARQIADRGCKLVCFVVSPKDMNRQVVRSAYATITIEELELELPPCPESNGFLSTIEGILKRVLADLEFYGDSNTNNSTELEQFIKKLNAYAEGNEKFTFTVSDPSGNSFIEHLDSFNDPNLKESYFERTPEQNTLVGVVAEESRVEDATSLEEKYCSFPTRCSACSSNACETNMQIVNIPFFKDILIMATSCEKCGFKSNEIKSAGQISEKGKKLTLSLLSARDLSRDILKSDSCSLEIPEIELKLETGTLGGRFTTIEGLLMQVYNELTEKCTFALGDSSSDSQKPFSDMLEQLKQIYTDAKQCTIILDDPLSNSYIQNIFAPDEDPQLLIEYYERSKEQNEEFGLNDMKVDE